MDISKIRKKAREKDKAAEVSPAPLPLPDEAKVESPSAGVDETPVAEENEIELTCTETEETLPPAAVLKPEDPDLVQTEDKGELTEILTFRLSNGEFAFKVTEVEEIIRDQSITKVPTLPEYVSGITSLRGKIIPVINLKKRLVVKEQVHEDEPAGEADQAGKEIKDKILIISGPKGFIGAAIDKVVGVMRFPQDNILEPPAHLSEEELKYIEGVVIIDKRFISIIRSEEALNIEVK
jgi:purine-binding chemotaxis protein CheW